MNTLASQRRIIAVSSMLVFSMGTVARLNRGGDFVSDDTARFYIGVGLAFTFVSVFADLGTPLGGGFALLILIAALMREGPEVFDFALVRMRRRQQRRPNRRRNQSTRRQD